MRATLNRRVCVRAGLRRELTRAYLLFQIDPLGERRRSAGRFAARYDRWQATARYPRLIKDIYLSRRTRDDAAAAIRSGHAHRSSRSTGLRRWRTGATTCSTRRRNRRQLPRRRSLHPPNRIAGLGLRAGDLVPAVAAWDSGRDGPASGRRASSTRSSCSTRTTSRPRCCRRSRSSTSGRAATADYQLAVVSRAGPRSSTTRPTPSIRLRTPR